MQKHSITLMWFSTYWFLYWFLCTFAWLIVACLCRIIIIFTFDFDWIRFFESFVLPLRQIQAFDFFLCCFRPSGAITWQIKSREFAPDNDFPRDLTSAGVFFLLRTFWCGFRLLLLLQGLLPLRLHKISSFLQGSTRSTVFEVFDAICRLPQWFQTPLWHHCCAGRASLWISTVRSVVFAGFALISRSQCGCGFWRLFWVWHFGPGSDQVTGHIPNFASSHKSFRVVCQSSVCVTES